MNFSWTEDDLNRPVSERFSLVVESCNESTALIDHCRSFTFLDIDRLSERIALFIHQSGISQKEAVAVMFGPSVYRVAGTLGVIRSGRPYVPLDPVNPVSRNLMILLASGAKIVITDHYCAEMACEIAGHVHQVVNPDSLPEKKYNNSLLPKISVTDPCVIIYTSGSTGKPKGVVHTHESVLCEARNTSLSMGLSTNDRFIQVSPIGSVASLSQTISAVLSGCVSIPFNLREHGLHTLGSWIREKNVTVFSGTPTVFRNLCKEFNTSNAFDKLRIVRLGGETVYWSDAALCRKHCSIQATFQVAYGSTETGINTVRDILHGTRIPKHPGIIPIGFPVQDKMIRLVDEKLLEVKMGHPGEILVGGKGLALEYFLEPGLSAERFLSFDTDRKKSKKFYRTGDIGHFNFNGELEFKGRFDEQVKIHGYRIECGEIEAAIMADEIICECTVNLMKTGEKEFLIAHIVLYPGYQFDEMSFRKSLANALPDSMIPGIFTVMEHLPINTNGKIDKKALLIPEMTMLKDLHPGTENLTIESELISLWEEVLHTKKTGMDDNFFHLGGDSLMMLTMVEEIRKRLYKIVNIGLFLQNPTIRNLTMIIKAEKGSNEYQVMKMGAKNDRIPLIVIGQGEYINQIANDFSHIRPVWYFFLPNHIELLVWKGKESDFTIRNMARIYTDLILKHIKNDKVIIAGYSFNGILAMEVASQLENAGLNPELVILFDTANRKMIHLIKQWKFILTIWLKNGSETMHSFSSTHLGKVNNLKYLRFKQDDPIFIAPLHKTILSRYAISGTVDLWDDFHKIMIYVHYQILSRYKIKKLRGKGILIRIKKRKTDIKHLMLPDYGWGRYFKGGLKTFEIESTHSNMVQSPDLKILIKKLVELLTNIGISE